MVGKIIAIILLIILLPLFALISILILIYSGSPIFYIHNRCGYKYAEIKMIKFRTMHPNNGPQLTEYKDNRITNIHDIRIVNTNNHNLILFGVNVSIGMTRKDIFDLEIELQKKLSEEYENFEIKAKISPIYKN